jgi:hypothetical protein
LQCFKGNTYCHGDEALNRFNKTPRNSKFKKKGKEINITKEKD